MMNEIQLSGPEAFVDTLFVRLANELPVAFTRREAAKLLGGVVCAGTLANLGKDGPPFVRMGRHAVYEKASFLEWLRTRVRNSSEG